MNLRIHHFFDIIRDFGRGNEIIPHTYGHSYHLVADKIWNNPKLQIKIVVQADAVCVQCSQLKSNHCIDTINHRKDYTSKEEFNNYLDKRILDRIFIREGETRTPEELCMAAKHYLEYIDWIYEGNDKENTKERKSAVVSELKCYQEKHTLRII